MKQHEPIDPTYFGEDKKATGYLFEIAGLQYYDYNREDDTMGKIFPRSGERLELVRQPNNKKDKNAIEVSFRNGQYQLCHVPRQIAKLLAPQLDSFVPVRAYMFKPGDGLPWSAAMVLFGPGIDALPKYIRDNYKWFPERIVRK